MTVALAWLLAVNGDVDVDADGCWSISQLRGIVESEPLPTGNAKCGLLGVDCSGASGLRDVDCQWL